MKRIPHAVKSFAPDGWRIDGKWGRVVGLGDLDAVLLSRGCKGRTRSVIETAKEFRPSCKPDGWYVVSISVLLQGKRRAQTFVKWFDARGRYISRSVWTICGSDEWQDIGFMTRSPKRTAALSIGVEMKSRGDMVCSSLGVHKEK